MKHLTSANTSLLKQAESLLGTMKGEQFCLQVASFHDSTVGQHLRHCLDHYRSFLAGLEGGKVDYDCRDRSVDLEGSIQNSLGEITRVKEGLEGVCEVVEPGILVKMDCGNDLEEWQASTIGRELQFLISHTVHHFAMIGGMCSTLGVGVPKGFGVAPSTLRHQKKLAASA